FFICEGDLREDLLELLSDEKYDLSAMITDDCLFYRSNGISYKDIEELLNRSVCYSFRLGKNTVVQNYVTGQLTPLPKFHEYKGHLYWDFRNMHPLMNFGYFYTQDGGVYLRE